MPPVPMRKKAGDCASATLAPMATRPAMARKLFFSLIGVPFLLFPPPWIRSRPDVNCQGLTAVLVQLYRCEEGKHEPVRKRNERESKVPGDYPIVKARVFELADLGLNDCGVARGENGPCREKLVSHRKGGRQ
ncbi:exported protein of unknown function [Pseudorhizobium banfieldiae]|uniref:Uncharacterized protein n=1 Tax=Pseudorhizobium banfieldiae TaxID=1125847 RepID=L0NDF2_9HYPH|nr:exported protein of unknown function [Pseudorhizobium banfieldiae]